MSAPQETRGGYLVETSTTRRVPPAERAEFWSDLVSSFHCRLRFDYPHRRDFHGTSVRQHTRTYQLVGWRSDEDVASRTVRTIKTDPDDDYRLIVPVAGRMTLRHGGRVVELRPGHAGLTPMSEPFQLWQGRGTEAFVLTAPRREFDRRLGQRAPRVAGLDLSVGLGRLIGDLAVGLFEERACLNREQFDAVSDRLVELVCLLLLGDDRPAPCSLHDIEQMARRYVRAHADDPALNPHSMASALGWSLRQVQLALKQCQTTPTKLIKEERLGLARDRLRSPVYRHRSITDIAHQLGFGSASAFSNAFHERYGERPRDMR